MNVHVAHTVFIINLCTLPYCEILRGSENFLLYSAYRTLYNYVIQSWLVHVSDIVVKGCCLICASQ